MTQKEKAELCDKAYDKVAARFGLNVANEIFTELRESEDERIRKEIISFLKSPFVNENITDEKVSPWVTWLEKQGQKETDPRYENLEELLAADDIYQMAMNDDMVQEAKTKVINALYELEICKLLGIEKQDEQEEPQVYETEDGEVITYSESEGYKVVEPKFKVGDWVIDKQGIVHQIERVVENVTNHTFGYDLVGGGYFNDTTEGVRLWTIQDAKDGDVLWHSDSASNGIFIFKEIRYDGKVLCYCDYDSEDHFCLGEHHTCCWANAKILHPATKEQRDLLIKKMKEAGYEWDAEKKELRKIEQEQIIDYIVNLPKDNWEFVHEFVEKFGKIPKDEDELNVLVEYVLKRQKPSTWSEEDERILNGLISSLVRIGANTRTDSTSINYTFPREINWLKSLKDRMGG